MKLHLPITLRRALLMSFVGSVSVASSSFGSVMHVDASFATYTDFGQNMGRYKTQDTLNPLLKYIRERDGGVRLTYLGGQPDYVLKHGMIDYSSQHDKGTHAALGYNWLATVEHNGSRFMNNATLTGNYIGSGNAIRYSCIEYTNSAGNVFMHKPSNDYKIARFNKLITDVTGSTVYGSTTGDYSAITEGKLKGQLLYRAGSGTQYIRDYNGVRIRVCGGYAYITGGIQVITGVNNINPADGAFSAWTGLVNPGPSGISDSAPLPFLAQPGDSGSPTWVWNDVTGQYEYLNAAQSVTDKALQCRGSCEWTVKTMRMYDKEVDLASTLENTVYINATAKTDEVIRDNIRSTTLWRGTVTDASGVVMQDFVGVRDGVYTWKDMAPLKDTNNWYSYGSSYMNGALSYADLYVTENLIFKAGAAENNVIVNADVDLGIGYVQFSKGDELESATYTVSGNHLLNSAGYIVDAGVDVHLQLTNPAGYMREWRKIGDGNLYLENEGNNNILLNVGGNGTTYLHAEGGYAAYNVLANNGTTVVVSNISQIARDFTFGFRGGTLDLQGITMDWNNSRWDATYNSEGAVTIPTPDPSKPGFSINALDEGARITNSLAGSTTTLTWIQGGTRTWLGSFTDTEGGGALRFIYNGGAGASLTMNSIYTNLFNEGSGIEVASGTLVLTGTNTIHGMGSLNGRNASRYFSNRDWHYADTTSPVTVKNGAVFELGSHARLTGNITVESGGTFTMREGVTHQMEYVEGGYTLEDTDIYRDYFGLKGDVSLQEGGSMKVEFSPDADSRLVYNGNISGAGSLTVDTGSIGGQLVLSGDNSGFSGSKNLTRGVLMAESNAALGDISANKWVIGAQGVLASQGFTGTTSSEEIARYIDSTSSGVLALTADRAEQLNLADTENLIIGAMAGQVIQYGEAGTDVELQITRMDENGRGQWLLGGGGGELVVNFRLSGDNDLVLGNEYGMGIVTLTNVGNAGFTGNILFKGGVTFAVTEAAALGQARVSLGYTNRFMALSNDLGHSIDATSNGAIVLDRIAGEALNLSNNQEIFLGAFSDTTYTGALSLAEGQNYHFGATTSMLTVDSAIRGDGGHGLVVDGQTYSGGRIVLRNVEGLTNDVLITGYDTTKKADASTGSITLAFTQDDRLAQASSVTIRDGGTLDLAGTTQTFNNNLRLLAGGTITDTSTGTGLLNFNVESGEIMEVASGTLDVASFNKMGEGELKLGSNGLYGQFNVKEGTVTLMSNNALAARGLTIFENNTVLNLNGKTVTGEIWLQDGVTVNAASGGINGTLIAIDGGTSIVNCGGTFGGDIGAMGESMLVEEKYDEATGTISLATTASSASTLVLKGSSLALSGAGINSAGGILESQLSSISLNRQGNQNVGGTLHVSNNLELKAFKYGKTIDINHMDVASGKTLTLTEDNGSAQKFAITWNIHNLSGEGTINWNANTQCADASRLVLDGENAFTGNFNFTKKAHTTSFPTSTTYNYGAWLVLGHDLAAQNMTLTLNGSSWFSQPEIPILPNTYHNAKAAMAINTANARLVGLNGNTLSHIFAGDAPSYSIKPPNTQSSSIAAGPVSTRQATLTITGSGAYRYEGTVGAGASGTTDGVSVVMEGTGSQTFTAAVTLRDAAAKAGTLILTNAGSRVTGNAAVAQGATLTLAGGLTLEAGQTLSVLSSEAGGVATLNAALTLNGGQLDFDIAALSAENAALSLGGLTKGAAYGTQIVSFTNTSSLQEGVVYKLSDGDWSSFSADSFTASGLHGWLHSTFTTGADGLSVAFTVDSNATIWDGTDAAHVWSSTAFGSDRVLPTDAIAIFNDTAANRNVLVSGDHTVNKISFDNTTAYLIEDAVEGGSLTADTLLKEGSGEACVDTALHVTGVVDVENGALTLKDATFDSTVTTSETGLVKVTGNLRLNVGDNTSLGFNLDATHGGTVTLNTTRDLTFNSGSLKADRLVLTGGSLNTNMEGIELGAVELADGTTMTVTNLTPTSGAGKKIGNVILGEGSTLKLFSSNNPNALPGDLPYVPSEATRIAGLTLKGSSATLSEDNFGGWWRVGSLNLAEGIETATLNLSTSHSANNIAVFDVGNQPNGGDAGNFRGVIKLNQTNNGGNRHAALVISHNDVATNAVISLSNPKSTSAVIGLGVHADEVRIKGLESASASAGRTTVFSGTVAASTYESVSAFKPAWIQDAKARTLHIDVDAGSNYSYYGDILGNVSLVKSGAGTQQLLGTANRAFNGAIDIQAGTLVFNSSSVGMLDTASTLSVGTAGTAATLDLSAITFDTAGTHAIRRAGDVIFGQDARLNLQANLTEEGAYQIFDMSAGGTLTGWETLTSANVSLGGGNIPNRLRLEFQAGGSLLVMQEEIVWAGGTSGIWNTAEQDWNTGESVETTRFFTGDKVTFRNDAVVTLGESLTAAKVTVEQGNTVTLNGAHTLSASALTVGGTLEIASGTNINVGGTLQLEKGAALNLDGARSGAIVLGNLTGAGTLTLGLTAEYANSLSIGSGAFTGEIYVRTGNFSLDSTSLGGTLRLGAGSNIGWSIGTNGGTFESSLVLEGASQMHSNGSRNLALTGTVTGGGTWEHRGSGTFRFQNMVDLGGYTQTSGSTVSTSFEGGSASIGTLTHSQGTLHVKNGTELAVTTLRESASGGLTLEQGGKLTVGGVTITGEQTGSAVRGNATAYAADNAAYSITRAEISYHGAGEATLRNTLTDVAVRNASSDGSALSVDLSPADTRLKSLEAESGSVYLINSPDQLIEMERLSTVGLNLVVGASASPVTRSAGAVELRVTQDVDLAAGTILETDLTLADGARLELGGPVSMGGNTLMLGSGLLLGQHLMEVLEELSDSASLTLFTDLGDIYLADAADTEALHSGDPVSASGTFSLPDSEKSYVLTWSGEHGNNELSISRVVPEPSTVTLGLLALTALAARRRRK